MNGWERRCGRDGCFGLVLEKMDGWRRGLERIASWGWWRWMVGGRVLKGRMEAGCVRKAGEGEVS
jgi:hypothetical protein